MSDPGVPVPLNHNFDFDSVPETKLKTAVTSMSSALLDLLAKL